MIGWMITAQTCLIFLLRLAHVLGVTSESLGIYFWLEGALCVTYIAVN